MPHFPILQILAFLLNFRHNRPFMRLGLFLLLALVAVSAISYAGDWMQAMDPASPACTIGKFGCYFGPTLSLPEMLSQSGAPRILRFLPLLDLAAALLLLWKPPRAYLGILILSILLGVGGAAAQPDPYLYAQTGSGGYLHMFCAGALFALTIPLAYDEQAVRNPAWDF